jgi:hypothetical protein
MLLGSQGRQRGQNAAMSRFLAADDSTSRDGHHGFCCARSVELAR